MARHAPADGWAPVDALLDLALAEDVGSGDVTTDALVPPEARASGSFVARRRGVLAGLGVVERLYRKLNAETVLEPVLDEGSAFGPGAVLARVRGPARALLTGERLALNLLQRMCGVATLTRAYAEALDGLPTKIMDTRKTLPGFRTLDKLAVCIGGGHNHRRGLHDMVLIKDNHLAFMRGEGGAGPAEAVTRARSATSLPLMVEVDDLAQLREVLEVEPDYVLLDNMTPETLREAVELAATLTRRRGLRRPLLEASGGVTLETVRALAETGVDRISVGAITHSAVALDIGLDLDAGAGAEPT